MRAVATLACLLSVTSAVSADPGIDPQTLPEQCRTIGKQASEPARHTALSARISLANCLADVRLAPLALVDAEASMLEVEDAVKQSFALLDQVAAQADDTTKIVAHQARAELYTNMQVRMLATLPSPGTTEASIALHRARKDILEALLARWRTGAARSYERVVEIVKASPRLEKNPVVAHALRVAKERLKLHVAKVEPPVPDRDAIITDDDQLR